MKVKMEVEGLSAVRDALAKLPRAIDRDVQRRVMRARLAPIAAAARSMAPRASGALQASIVVSDKLTARQRGLFKAEGPDDVHMFAGAGPLPEAHMMEFGTRKARAHPFMRPAWDAHRLALLPGLAEDFWREIARAIGG
jgi:HK97 gp10 family phage protein